MTRPEIDAILANNHVWAGYEGEPEFLFKAIEEIIEKVKHEIQTNAGG
jgi:hypothetical protein